MSVLSVSSVSCSRILSGKMNEAQGGSPETGPRWKQRNTETDNTDKTDKTKNKRIMV